MVNNTYKNEFPVVSQTYKPNKILFTNEDLQNADKFSFGSIIGRITNCVTAIRTIMSDFDKESDEYNVLINRMRMGCKLQAQQIDKAKIGKDVKGIPNIWYKYNKVLDNDDLEVKNEKLFYNSLLCNKHPYFFTHLYSKTKNEYRKYLNKYSSSCKKKWNLTIEELKQLENKSLEQQQFLNRYEYECPIIINNSVMNMLCYNIEDFYKNIKNNIKTKISNFDYNIYKNNEYMYDKKLYDNILYIVNDLRDDLSCLKNDFDIYSNHNELICKHDSLNKKQSIYDYYYSELLNVCFNVNDIHDYNELLNCIVDIFYKDYVSYDKNILWDMFGKDLFENVKLNSDPVVEYPEMNDNGDIYYLGKKYKINKYNLSEEYENET